MTLVVKCGDRYHNCVVVRELPVIRYPSRTSRVFECQCDCGQVFTTLLNRLRTGKTKSCGCYIKSWLTDYNLKHGMTGTPLHKIWRGMIQRCYDQRHSGYKNYGGRGITVCEKRKDFSGFYNDMHLGYKEGLSIDRIIVDGNYCKDNCRRVTMKEQSQNTRKTIRYNGKCLAEVCREKGIPYSTVLTRVKNGMPIEQALQ